MTLARFLFLADRLPMRTPSALAPAFFCGDVATGFPAALPGTWLKARGVPNPVGFIAHCERKGILVRRGARHVFALQPDDAWAWQPATRQRALADWSVLERGAPDPLAQALGPLLACRDLTTAPGDTQGARWVAAARRLAEVHGLDLLREAIAGAVMDPDALYPFEGYVFERHFSALVLRARRAA